jgi:DNA-binding XRE family transcriptional regulator
MRINGETFEFIAKELKVSKQTLINWSKEDEVKESLQIERTI